MAYTNQTKNTTDYTNQDYGSSDFILREDGDFMLREDGSKFLREDNTLETYSNQTKNTTVYSNQTKN